MANSLLDVILGNAPQQQLAKLPYTPMQSPSGLGIDYLKKRYQEVTTPQPAQPMTKQEAMDFALGIAPLGMIKVAGIPTNEILFPNKALSELKSAEKSAITRYEKALSANPAVRRREELKYGGTGNITNPNIEMIQQQGVNPESLLGSTIVPVLGDQSATGYAVKQIAGIPLQNQVNAQGGSRYSLIKKNADQGIAWASEPSAATTKTNNLNAPPNYKGGDVVGVFSAMSPEGINFSHHMAEGMLGQIPVIKPPQTAVKQLDKAIRDMPLVKELDDGTKVKSYPFKSFAGVTSPNVWEQISKGTDTASAGNLRKAIVDRMSLAEFRNMGFPNWQDTFNALAEKGLNTGSSGSMMFKAKPNANIVTPDYTHGSYSAGIQGNVMGGLLDAKGNIASVPDDVMFRQTYERLRKEGKTDAQIRRSMMMAHHGEVLNQQTLDGIMRSLGYLK